MAIIAMQKVRLLVHRSHVAEVLEAIQEKGAVEFVEVAEAEASKLTKREQEHFDIDRKSSRLDQAVSFLLPYAEEGGLRGMFEGGKVVTSSKDAMSVAESFEYDSVVNEVQEIQKNLSDARARIKELEHDRDLLRAWHEMELPLGAARETKHTQLLFVEGEQNEMKEFETQAAESKLSLHVESVGSGRFVVVFLHDEKDAFDTLFKKYDLSVVDLPQREETPEKEVVRIDEAIDAETNIIEENEGRARELTASLPQLKQTSDVVLWEKEAHALAHTSYSSEHVALFEGWLPKNEYDSIEALIQDVTNLYALETIEAAEGERTPVEIKNNKIVEPFEAVTRLYGLPGYDDIDPTLFLAGFFFIFFGLSLTDVGYGIILFVLTSLILFFYTVPKGMKLLLQLFMLGGLASALVGLLFGGYLGIDPSQLPGWAQSLQAFDPIQNPIPVFYLALAFGVVHILVGLTLKIVREAKNGNFLDGFLDQAPWIFVFLSLIAWGANSFGYLPGDAAIYLYVIYAALASLVLTQGRKEKNIFMKLFKGVFSLYGSINFLSDILSYSRLLALGLATSALAFAVNLIAGMVKDVPYVGIILMIAILVVGHLFNLAVNVLGAFIHSSRLQFVEFFGKFISGSGRSFKPLAREERYVTLK